MIYNRYSSRKPGAGVMKWQPRWMDVVRYRAAHPAATTAVISKATGYSDRQILRIEKHPTYLVQLKSLLGVKSKSAIANIKTP